MSNLRSLRRKQRRRTTYECVLDDATEAQDALERAFKVRRLALLRNDDDSEHPDVVAAEQTYKAALAELREHVVPIVFEQIPRHEYEEMQSEPRHAPTPEQLVEFTDEDTRAQKAGRERPAAPTFNPHSLIPALFARCVVPADGEEPLTEQEWAHELRPDGDWQESEVSDAFETCLTAILEPRSVTVPKG